MLIVRRDYVPAEIFEVFFARFFPVETRQLIPVQVQGTRYCCSLDTKFKLPFPECSWLEIPAAPQAEKGLWEVKSEKKKAPAK